MIFNSFQFLWLFPIIFITYYAIIRLVNRKQTNRWDNMFLIIVSYAVYMQWHPIHGLLLFGITIWSYLGSKLIVRTHNNGMPKYIFGITIIGCLIPLLTYKYLLFICQDILQLDISTSGFAHILVPIGISFYTFQTIGYVFDVYRQKVTQIPSFVDYILFVAFFPQILSGPINRALEMLPQIQSKRTFNYNQALLGVDCLVWGCVLKCVIADRLGIYVDTVYGGYNFYSGLTCFVASIFYSIEIYCDFAGYSLMAFGAARLLGFEIINNFNHPYASATVSEFWHRWHISLSTWLKDYVYIPLGGSRCSKIRNYCNILITFLVSGIWHGANWTFIFWGGLHGIAQVIEKMAGLNKKQTTGVIHVLQVIITLLIINLAWIFFRLPSIDVACGMISHIVTNFKGELMTPNNTQTFLISFAFILFLITETFYSIKGITTDRLFGVTKLSHLAGWIICICMIILCGVLDSSQFIYVSF